MSRSSESRWLSSRSIACNRTVLETNKSFSRESGAFWPSAKDMGATEWLK